MATNWGTAFDAEEIEQDKQRHARGHKTTLITKNSPRVKCLVRLPFNESHGRSSSHHVQSQEVAYGVPSCKGGGTTVLLRHELPLLTPRRSLPFLTYSTFAVFTSPGTSTSLFLEVLAAK